MYITINRSNELNVAPVFDEVARQLLINKKKIISLKNNQKFK
jgi:hypothetical protein